MASTRLKEAQKMVRHAHPKWPEGAIVNQTFTCVQLTASHLHVPPHAALEAALGDGLIASFNKTIFWDWKAVAEEVVIDDFEILIIPKNTALFHGTNIDVFPEGEIARDYSYFSDLRSAANYAFKESADVGQLLIMATNIPLTIFRMTPKNIKLLKQRYPANFPDEAFEYAYSYTKLKPKRSSHPIYDGTIQGWWCSQKIPFHGFGDRKYEGFHPEVALCHTSTATANSSGSRGSGGRGSPLIRRLPYRYRLDVDFWECIMLIDDKSGDVQPFPKEMIARYIKWGWRGNLRKDEETRIKQLDPYADKAIYSGKVPQHTKYSGCMAGEHGISAAEHASFRKLNEDTYLYPVLTV